MQFIHTTLRQEPKRLEYLGLTQSFFKSIDLPLLMNSGEQEERDLAMEICSTIMQYEPKLTMDNFVTSDQHMQEFIYKSSHNKIWQAVN